MTRALLSLLVLCACAPAQAQDSAADRIAERDLREFTAMLPGTYTNEEQVYFHGELDRPEATALPRLTLTIVPDGDGFVARTESPSGRTTEARLSYRAEDGAIRSREVREGQPDCERVFTRHFETFRGEGCGAPVIASPEGFVFGPAANPFVMHRARPFTCWVSPRKPDGSYGFRPGLRLHDQGGRSWVEGEDFERVGIKMRRVRWPAGRNRDSLVLYAYRGADEDGAVSYAWTGPDSDRIALNLRWMQASCTLDAD